MKAILIALGITIMGYGAAEAHDCNAKKTVRKHKSTTHVVAKRNTAVQTKTTSTCRVVPNQVCSISADRKTVSCYKTTDDDNLTPMNSETSVYGPIGQMPGKMDKGCIETVVIGGPAKGNYCMRDEANKMTICRYSGWKLNRDAAGNYSYQKLAEPWVSPLVVKNNESMDPVIIPGIVSK